MMDFIMVPTIMAIITLGIYKLFELFVCKKERLTIIEKFGDKLTPDMLEHKFSFSSLNNISFSALKIGSLLAGMGLGLLIGYIVCATSIPTYVTNLGDRWEINKLASVVYGACVLLCGGVGLIIAFIVEIKLSKNK